MEELDKIRGRMGSVQVPTAHSLVYKDECMFSYDTPFSSGGLAVNLNSLQGFGEHMVELDFQRTSCGLYLLQKWTAVPKTEAELEAEAEAVKASAAAGTIVIPGKDSKVEKQHWLMLMPEKKLIEYPNQELPTLVSQACDGVIAHEGNSLQQNVAAFVDDFEAKESKYARSLEQLPSEGKRIPSDPKQWRCDESGVTENLWLNLSTGFIGSGRKNWDGSGGNGAAERHWESTGKKYPLVVKLGTITPHGADVFSYAADENDMVIDPLLSEHLAHWGIDIMKLEKTEKTMAELQVTLNMEHDWSKITEGSTELEPLSGPSLVGIANLGNSCYINSVMQCIFSIPEIVARYPSNAEAIFRSAPANPANDFPSQMAKFGVGLTSDRYADTAKADDGPASASDVCVRPLAFRSLVGQGHSEFSTGRQQDATEYLQHLLEVIVRSERTTADRLGAVSSTKSLFEVTMEEKIQCVESGQVRYKEAKQNVVFLPVPMEAATNGLEFKEYQEKKRAKTISEDATPVVAHVPFEACIGRLTSDEMLSDFYSTALKRNGIARKTQRFKSFPPYLVLQVNRYYIDTETWEPKKNEVEVPMPETIDLERYRATGLLPGEVELPEEEEVPAADAAPPIDMAMVEQLMQMGFSENGCKRAVKEAGQSGIEAASEWIFAHMSDDDFNAPLDAGKPAGAGGAKASAEDVSMLTMLGFNDEQARAALIASDNNRERAAEWLFSRADNLDAAVAEVLTGATAPDPASGGGPVESNDGPGRYSLFGIVSHLGKHTGSGHYVCHVKKDGRWVIFNDLKVGLSKAPPLDVGYMYFYKRE